MLLFLLSMTLVSAADKTHIIFMLVDDLGWNDVGWHDPQINTPKLDQLVNESIVLTNYYVYRFCSPSRSTFMTGRYPWHIGQQSRMNLNPTPGIACGINLQYSFMPEVLKKAPQPYTTWALGKWHLGFLTDAYTPTYRGFDHYLGYYSGAEEHFTHLKQGYYDLANNTGKHIAPCRGPVGPNGTYSSYLFGNETLRMLEGHNPEDPLYIYLAWNNVHAPCEAPQNYIDANMHIKNPERRLFAAMMSALDDQLTSVIDLLKKKDMWKDTLLVFSTDNGGNLGGGGNNYPLRGGKYTFWQGGVRGVSFVAGGAVPQERQGSYYDGMIHAADWYSSFAALAGASTDNTGPLSVDGLNVLPALLAGTASPRTEVVLQIESTDSAEAGRLPTNAKCTGGDEELCSPPPIRAAPARPYPATAACDPASEAQQWTVDTTTGTICRSAQPSQCFNVQQGKGPVILYAPSSNDNFTFSNGELMENGKCVYSAGKGQQLQWVDCHSTSGQRWVLDATRQHVQLSFENGTQLCVEAVELPSTLALGALIQGKWKLITGYPGWNDAWDGWPQPPTAPSPPTEDRSHKNTFCVKSPCLFNIESDPTEHNDVSKDNPDIVQSMVARVHELLKNEVTVAESGLCPTKYGSRVDPRCEAKAKLSGFWEPWLNSTVRK